MGRRRKQVNSKLPKGVYRTSAGLFEAKTIKGKRQDLRVGPFVSPEEAEYKFCVAKYGNHWGPVDPKCGYGFIYVITERATDKAYVGKKALEHWDGPPGGYKNYDKSGALYDEKAWKASGWEFYTGSSIPLNNAIARGNVWDYTYEILSYHSDPLALHLAEIELHMDLDVLEAKGPDGQYLFYNENIGGYLYRPHFDIVEAAKVAAKTAEEARRYYLKPQLDAEGTVIPFENRETVVRYKTSYSKPSGGTFDDIR